VIGATLESAKIALQDQVARGDTGSPQLLDFQRGEVGDAEEPLAGVAS
jgi:hypothetical protein